MKQSLVGFSSVGEGSLHPPDLFVIEVATEIAFETARFGFRHLFNVNEDVFRGGTYV